MQTLNGKSRTSFLRVSILILLFSCKIYNWLEKGSIGSLNIHYIDNIKVKAFQKICDLTKVMPHIILIKTKGFTKLFEVVHASIIQKSIRFLSYLTILIKFFLSFLRIRILFLKLCGMWLGVGIMFWLLYLKFGLIIFLLLILFVWRIIRKLISIDNIL